jgi:alpha-glucosidase
VGARGEDACRRAIELRYRLLPYMYTVFEEAARTGLPVLRPLFLRYLADPAARVADQALLGAGLMLAPVLHPAKTAREVYLPAGRWEEFRTGLGHRGAATIVADADDAPVFVCGGTVLPVGPVRRHVDEQSSEPLELYVVADESGRAAGRLYEDDGCSFRHEDEACCTTSYTFANGVLRAER